MSRLHRSDDARPVGFLGLAGLQQECRQRAEHTAGGDRVLRRDLGDIARTGRSVDWGLVAEVTVIRIWCERMASLLSAMFPLSPQSFDPCSSDHPRRLGSAARERLPIQFV